MADRLTDWTVLRRVQVRRRPEASEMSRKMEWKTKNLFTLVLTLLSVGTIAGQAKPLSAQMADTAMTRIWTDSPNGSGIPPKWVYDYGVILNGMKSLWQTTGDRRYYDFIKRGVDAFVNEDGSIKTYRADEYNLDQVCMASAAMMMYRVTGEIKYKKAVDLIRSQLKTHPRTNEGGFWHKRIYPYQMWLDGLYMAEPFYAEYSAVFGENNWNDIANQFIWMERHARDDKTGLLYHAWDESKRQQWADKQTGRAPMFWGRAMGWYAMALVDVLDYFPKDHPKRADLIAILNREMAAVGKVQDKNSGVWWLILDMPGREKNYLEASSSAMFAYAMAKGVRNGYLPASFLRSADVAWAGIGKQFIEKKTDGIDLVKTIGGAGLGGNPYRAGDYNYYVNERVVTNDPKGIGAFLLAAAEMESSSNIALGRGKTVILDGFFNHEIKKDDNGRDILWHYRWDEWDNGGYSLWGDVFQRLGARTATLDSEPIVTNLKSADVYIIVDPDTDKETPRPNYIQPQHIDVLSDWVKNGGVLVLMGNDAGNAEFKHFNALAAKFGVQFNEDSLNRVQGNNFEQGKVDVTAGNPVLSTARILHLKEVSSLTLREPAKPLISQDGHILMATSKYGKGTVFAVGDPWLYNEYTDGRKLPVEYENFRAAQDLSRWLLSQTRRK
jgi:unsaturated rhamnogalacturonyl hydrolase